MSTIVNRDELVSEYVTINRELYRAWKKVFYDFVDAKGLKPTLIATLQAAQEMQPATGHQIAERMRVTDGAVTRLVDYLVCNGYVDRSTDSHDRRVKNLVLTDQGKKLMTEIKQKRSQLVQKLTSELSVDELRLANEVNRKILQAIEK